MRLERTPIIRLCLFLGALCASAYILAIISSTIFSSIHRVYRYSGGRARNFLCEDRVRTSYLGRRGRYWVLYNYIVGSRTFACDESITFTTPADIIFLDKLVPLLHRWHGPVSVALYAPGTDFQTTLARINYLRECSSPLVKAYATFHIFFDHDNIPHGSLNFLLKEPREASLPTIHCGNSLDMVPGVGQEIISFRNKSKLFYPINVGRNIAKEMATTHYILGADIELFPSPNLIPKFLEMIKRNDSVLSRLDPQVFVLPIFEVEANVTQLPKNKAELQELLKKGAAVRFHKLLCPACHTIPKSEEWEAKQMGRDIHVFHIGKRHGEQEFWEPIFIGTKLDPEWDERLNWEGRGDKMTQNYIMCLLDYEYLVLDNAFLVHSPGIKRKAIIPNITPWVQAQYNTIQYLIVPEIKVLYGNRKYCKVLY